ncbi:MAG: DegV family protein [Lachnospiraceae bacterium]|jgi:DegV family protein with EDD domain|nr:DegV family protein [Lachnospiraceae bacterium]
MNDYIVSCCTSADLSKEYLKSRNIECLSFHYELDGVQHEDDFGETISYPDFYKAMENGADTRTSQVNQYEYEEYFDKFLSQGKDIIHITLSSGISGSYNSARLAMEVMREKYPDRKIYVVDSLLASSGHGLLADAVADRRDEGMSVDEAYKWVDEFRYYYHAWFFTTDLTFFIKGGRVSKASGFIGGVLNICPLLNMDYMGRLIPRYKIRTKAKVIRQTVDVVIQHMEGGADYQGKCFISHSNCPEDAEAVKKLLEEKVPALKGKIQTFYIGTLIGCHTGPGTVAVFFKGDKRVD